MRVFYKIQNQGAQDSVRPWGAMQVGELTGSTTAAPPGTMEADGVAEEADTGVSESDDSVFPSCTMVPRQRAAWPEVEAGVASRTWTLGAFSEILDNFVLFPTEAAMRQREVKIEVETDPPGNSSGSVDEIMLHDNAVGLTYNQLRTLLSSTPATASGRQAAPDSDTESNPDQAPYPTAAACLRVASDCLIVSKTPGPSGAIVAGLVSRRLQAHMEETRDLLVPSATLDDSFAALPGGEPGQWLVGQPVERMHPTEGAPALSPALEQNGAAHRPDTAEAAGTVTGVEEGEGGGGARLLLASGGGERSWVWTCDAAHDRWRCSGSAALLGAGSRGGGSSPNHASVAVMKRLVGAERWARMRDAVGGAGAGTWVLLFNMAEQRELGLRGDDVVLHPPDQVRLLLLLYSRYRS